MVARTKGAPVARNHIGLLVGAVAVGALVATPQAEAAEARQEYHLMEQDLGTALRAAGQVCGCAIMFSSDLVAAKRAPRLDGRLTAEDAVSLLLKGSGLTFSSRNGAITILGRSDPSDAAAAAFGQDVAPAEGHPDDIVVTGSRIRGAAATAPVIVASRQDIEEAGQADLGEYARSVPQNFAGGQNPGVTGGGNQGGNANTNSSSTLNLRGLGADATLTLINGHRLAYDALNQGVDISAIPLAAIARVEIVADGASALYGSDAVGGVANVILRRDFDGLLTSARVGASTDGGYEQQRYNAVAGARWSSGGVMGAVDFSRNSNITARDRSYTRAIDDSTTLFPYQKQIALVGAGHQNVGEAIELELDAQYSHRISETANAFFTTGDVSTNGLITRPEVISYSATPTLRVHLPSNWTASLSGTYAASDTNLLSRRFTASVELPQRLRYKNRMKAVELAAEGRLFNAPGGDARLAIGGGYRGVDLYVHNTRTTGGVVTTTADYSGGRDIFFGYGELALPLIGPHNSVPFLNRLSITGAVRYEKYRGLADVTTPKFGLIYKPVRDISLKATWGKSFKAPTLQQELQVPQSALLNGSNFVNYPANRTVLLISGGGTGLQPERATTWTSTIEFTPRFVDGLRIEASYFNVRYRNRIAVPITSVVSAPNNPIYANLILYNPTPAQLAAIIAGLPQGLSNQTGRPYDPATVGAVINSSLQNLARQKAEGVDITLTYRRDIGVDSKLNLTGSLAYLTSDQQLSPGQPTIQRAGTIFDPPHWRGRAGVSWEQANLTLASFANYIGGTLDDRYQPFVRVGAFLSFDATARLRSRANAGLAKNFDVSASILNIANRKPDIIRNLNAADPPYDSANYPVTGRTISLTLTKAW